MSLHTQESSPDEFLVTLAAADCPAVLTDTAENHLLLHGILFDESEIISTRATDDFTSHYQVYVALQSWR